ncbi:MAG TPA: hypothetical protein ENJ12_09795 [Thiolapillus brandeum]|uniref:TIGR03016 family PEP-CTERM system-associated outer membrane protein n=1 Tax=Thiolapillus brandeum TaxID=1076588 RepID=A0A831RYR8_9GAMM|nr:hypothetical protein [Thiolapillus brandeum]
MGIKNNNRWILVCLCAGVAATAASVPATMVHAGESVKRPFGTIRTWLNVTDPRLRPLTESSLTKVGGRSYLPPRVTRQGLIPRVGISEEYNDNLFFRPDDKIADYVTTIAPGVHYSRRFDQGKIDLDYTLQSTIYARNDDLNDTFEAQTANLAGSWQFNKRTGLEISENFETFKDPTESAGINVLPRLGRIHQNIFKINGSHDLDSASSTYLHYTNFLTDYGDPVAISSVTHEFTIGGQTRPGWKDSLGLDYRYTYYDTAEGTSLNADTVFGHYTHIFSETLLVRGKLGVARVRDEDSPVDPVGNLIIRASRKYAILDITFEQDLLSGTLGLGSVYLSRGVGGTLSGRLAKGLRLNTGVSYSNIKNQTGTNLDLRTLSANAGLTYGLSRWLFLQLDYDYIRQKADQQNIVSKSNKVLFSVVASFPAR